MNNFFQNMMNGMFNQNNSFTSSLNNNLNDSMHHFMDLMHESSNHMIETGKKFFNHQMNSAQNGMRNIVESSQNLMQSKNSEDLMKVQKNFVANSVNQAMQNSQEMSNMINESAMGMYNMMNKGQNKQEASSKK